MPASLIAPRTHNSYICHSLLAGRRPAPATTVVPLHADMIQQGGAAGAMAGLRATYATAAVPKGWAGHRLEMRNGVGPFISMASAPPVAGASIFEGVGGDRGSPGLADKVLDDLTLRSKMESHEIPETCKYGE